MPGMAADIVMLDGDIENCPINAISDIPIALAICAGVVTFRSD